jgi:hypothetical protein
LGENKKSPGGLARGKEKSDKGGRGRRLRVREKKELKFF